MARLETSVLEEIREVLVNNGLSEGMCGMMEIFLNQAMVLERNEYLQASPYERVESRQGLANGFKPKQVKTRIGELKLSIPQTRESGFYPSCLEKGLRSEKALIATMGEMWVLGVSDRKVTRLLKEMCGLEISSSQVSRAAQELDESLKAWRERPLGHFSYLIVDARYEKVRYGGSIQSLAVIWAIAVTEDGQREVVGVSVALSEAEVHWRSFFQDLVKRGLHGLTYIVSDNHEGLKAALKAVFPTVLWNRCHTHLARNAQDHVKKKGHKDDVAGQVRDILQAPDPDSAKRLLDLFITAWKTREPNLASWAESNIPEGFSVFQLPKKIRKNLRTTNLIERLNQELKRRSRVVRIFPNQDSCLRLMSALMLDFHESWINGRRLFNLQAET